VPSGSPTSTLLCSPPIPSSSSATATVSLAGGLPRCEHLFLATGCMCSLTHQVSESGHRVPVAPELYEEERGPPRLPGRPLRACRGRTPRRIQACPRPDHGQALVAFEQFSTLGIRDGINFEAAYPTAHALACLRFAGDVTVTVARLATGSGGLTLGRAGFAPAGRLTKFHGDIASSYSLRPAVPGRTETLILAEPADRRRSRNTPAGGDPEIAGSADQFTEPVIVNLLRACLLRHGRDLRRGDRDRNPVDTAHQDRPVFPTSRFSASFGLTSHACHRYDAA